MSGPERWAEPDWDWIEPIEFDEGPLRVWSTLTVILLGGVIIGLVAAFWHLAG